jgi:endoglucanase
MLTRLLTIIVLTTISSLASQVPAERLELLSKGISIPHWYWMRSPDALVDHYINDEDIHMLVAMGVKHIRIPFDVEDLNNAKIVKQLKMDIKRLTDAKLGVIVSAFGHNYNRDLICTQMGSEILKLLCSQLKDTSQDYVFIQIANEPTSDEPKNWSTVQNKLLKVARQVLPNHTLITSTPLKFDTGLADWDGIKALQAVVPSEDKNVVYGFHFYDPYFFTHQNVEWDKKTRHIKNLVYPTDASNAKSVISGLPKSTPIWVIKSLGEKWDKPKLKERLKPIIEWRNLYQRPVMVTEFGVYKKHADAKSRERWIADITSLFLEEAILWTFWGYEGGFGIFNTIDGFRELETDILKVLSFKIPGK